MEGFFRFGIRGYFGITHPQAPGPQGRLSGLEEEHVKNTLPSFILQSPNFTKTTMCSGYRLLGVWILLMFVTI